MKIASSIVAFLAAFGSMAAAIDVGDTIPADLTLHHGFPPESISLDGRLSGKNVLLIGLPGAFTPT
jgi:peroxiredoxin